MNDEDLSFFEEEEFKENLARYESMLQGGPSAYLDADELTDIAEYYLNRQRQQEADACIQYALQLHPGSTDPLIFIARQKMFAGDQEGAKAIRDSISDANDREVVFLNAELLLHETTGAEEASKYLEQQIGNYEDTALFIYDSAYIFIDYGFFEEALKWAQRYAGQKPDSKKCKYLFADAYGGLYETDIAKRYINQILDENPYAVKYWLLLADMQLQENRINEAIDSCDFALAIDENHIRALLFKAGLLSQNGDFDTAHQLLDRYCELCPWDETGFLYDGALLNNQNRYEEAYDTLQKALSVADRQSPNLAQIYQQISFTCSCLHHEEEAFRYLDMAYGLDKNPVDYLVAQGNILLENRHVDEACFRYMEAVHKSETPYETLLTGCMALCESYYTERAYPYLRLIMLRATSKDTKEQALAYLTFCCGHMNLPEKYLYYLKKICEDNPQLARSVLGDNFPDIPPEEYYDHVRRMLNIDRSETDSADCPQ